MQNTHESLPFAIAARPASHVNHLVPTLTKHWEEVKNDMKFRPAAWSRGLSNNAHCMGCALSFLSLPSTIYVMADPGPIVVSSSLPLALSSDISSYSSQSLSPIVVRLSRQDLHCYGGAAAGWLHTRLFSTQHTIKTSRLSTHAHKPIMTHTHRKQIKPQQVNTRNTNTHIVALLHI